MVRIHTSLLPHLVLQHYSSAVDTAGLPALSMPFITGSTLWKSGPGEIHIEIAWRWAEMRAAIVMLDPQRIETNFLLLDPAGVEEPRLRAVIHIVQYVETLPWRRPVHELLLDSRH